MIEFLKKLIGFFDEHKIPYMLSGGVAMGTYALPRFTKDFDFIVHLKPADALLLAAHFKEGYYCDEDSIKDAIEIKGFFNIIDHKSNYKADFILLKDDPFSKIEFERRKQKDFLGLKIYIVSVEDLLLSKLIWIQEIQSPLQAEDIKQLAEIAGLDWLYIRNWIDKLKLNTFGII
jgi:hypothetical protein